MLSASASVAGTAGTSTMAAATPAAKEEEQSNALEAPHVMASYERANVWATALEKSVREFRDATGRARQIAEMRRSLRGTGVVDEARFPDGIALGKLIDAIMDANGSAEQIREAGDSVYRIVNGGGDVGDGAAASADKKGECPESVRSGRHTAAATAAGNRNDDSGAGDGPCSGR